MTRKSDDIRALVIAALMAGEGVCDVSRRFNLSKATVSRIKSRLGKDDLKSIETTKKGQKLSELVYKCLSSNFEALAFIATAIQDENWLKRNKAADVAVLYGVMADKASRITEAVQAGHDNQDPDPVETPAGAPDPGLPVAG